VLAARQVARRLVVYVVPVVLLALSGGAATLAGAYAGTARALSDDVAVLRNGSDVRVALPAGHEADAASLAAYAGTDGVATLMPVLVDDARAGEIPFTLVAAPSADLESVMRAPEGVADVGLLAAATAPASDALVLPGDARTIRLRTTASVRAIGTEWGGGGGAPPPAAPPGRPPPRLARGGRWRRSPGRRPRRPPGARRARSSARSGCA
jgi:hypothetical protein